MNILYNIIKIFLNKIFIINNILLYLYIMQYNANKYIQQCFCITKIDLHNLLPSKNYL